MHTYPEMKVLVVDDDADLRKELKDMLAELKVQIFEASNGVVALKILKKQTIDIAIIDIIMPEMDGIELLRELQVNYPKMLNIVITGNATNEKIKKVFEAKAHDFMEKPFRRQVFIKRVEKALETLTLHHTVDNLLDEVADEFGHLVEEKDLENMKPKDKLKTLKKHLKS